MDEIGFEKRDRVGWITLNRPKAKNAFTLDMIDRWVGFIESASIDPEVAVLVVTGTGDSFCSGVDLAVLRELKNSGGAIDWKNLLWERVHRVAFALERMDKPVIAAVNGVAVGAGMDMSLMCDMRFCSESATFCEGYIRIGAVPGDGGCYFLPRIVGSAKALELLMGGEFIDSAEALRIGLVNHVYPDAELQAKTQNFAELLSSRSQAALRIIKRAVYQSERMDMRTSLDLISSHMGIVQTMVDRK